MIVVSNVLISRSFGESASAPEAEEVEARIFSER